MDNQQVDQIGQVLSLLQFQRLFFLVVAIAILVLINRLISRFADRLSERFNARRLLILQITTVVTFFIYVTGVPTIFYISLSPPKELLLALGGSIAVAIGFAIKDVVSSFVSGIVLLFDRPFQVGDRVTIGDTYGEVKSIGLRAVRVVTLDDNVVTIPNTKLITEQVASGNFGALDMMIVVNFHLALDEDIERIIDILTEVVVTSRFAYLAKPVSIVVSEVEVAQRLALKFSVKSYVLDVRYEKAYQTDLVSRASRVFKESQVRRPTREGVTFE